ncbi:MAG: DUF1559 domain-containing protein [Planctomycetales bacterium]|nr:DUF1559 domain-containing protein [Planctomycetales bacterium]
MTKLPPFTFTIRKLLAVTAAIAVSLMPLVWWNIYDALPVTALTLAATHAASRRKFVLAFSLACILLFCFLSLSGVHSTPRSTECLHNMQMLANALRIYHAEHGHFPPPYLADENGNPMHSWRVLILPYIDRNDLYERYDFSKPWDHPDNLLLSSEMPDIFRCPSDVDGWRLSATSYVAIVGNRTMWPPGTERSLSDVSDDVASTILIVESRRARSHWMSPVDLCIEEIHSENKAGETLILANDPYQHCSCAMADGHVSHVPQRMPATVLKTAATIDDDT